MNGITRRLPKAYIQRLFTDKEDRLQLSRKSFEKYIHKKIDQFNKTLDTHYNGEVSKWCKSKEQDNHRLINNIIDLETI